MSTTQPQIVPAMPAQAENSTPAEAPRAISLARPSPADNKIDAIPDRELTTKESMRLRMRDLIARVVVLSERIAELGITRAELDAEAGEPCTK